MYDELVKRLRKTQKLAEFAAEDVAKMPNMIFGEAADAIEELQYDLDIAVRAEAAATEACKPRWIPVTERLPPYGDRILVTDKTGVWEGYLSYSRGFMRNTGMTIKDIYDVEVTHWMPLPEPPKEAAT